MRLTLLAVPVVSVDPIWKMNTEFAFPSPSNVNSPVKPDDVDAV
jgi:hypothetical protein